MLFFLNIVKQMNMSLGQELLTNADHIEDPVLKIIERSKKHSSVVTIFENHEDSAFSFTHVSLDEITKEIKRLNVKKACQNTDIFLLNLSRITVIYLQISFSLTSTIA